jgi:large conductance mechanosensitive channel
MLGEFKDFAMRGSMIDMAVGIIVGAAFGRVVNPFVSDVLMPPIGLFTGNSDFPNRFINLSGHAYATLAEAKAAGAATINYGLFFNSLSDFLIVAFVVSMLIRQVNRLKNERKASVPVTRDCPFASRLLRSKQPAVRICTSGLATAKVEFEGGSG